MSALSSAVSRSASAKTTLGFLPPSSRAIFLTVSGALTISRLPVSTPPVKETRSTRGSVESGAPASAPAPRTRLATPAGSARLLQQPHQVDRGVRGELAGLEDEGVARQQAGRDLPRDLEQRVVPRGDERADPDRLVHHARLDVVAADVHGPLGLVARDRAVVAEDAGDVVDVVLALGEPLAGVQALHPGDGGLVALEQVGDPEQQRRRARAGSSVAATARRRTRLARRGDRGLGVRGGGLVDGRRPACRRQGSGSPGGHPRGRSPTTPLRTATALGHPVLPFDGIVAHGATRCSCRNAMMRLSMRPDGHIHVKVGCPVLR